jgi:hypothetical protein
MYEESTGPNAVLECGLDGVGLIFDQCKEGFTCVEHSGILNKRTGVMGTYALCERSEL